MELLLNRNPVQKYLIDLGPWVRPCQQGTLSRRRTRCGWEKIEEMEQTAKESLVGGYNL